MNAWNWLSIETARQKTATIGDVVEHLLGLPSGEPTERSSVSAGSEVVPKYPGRDVEIVLNIRSHPPKPGIATTLGQARMLHDLGNIELQAMELAIRTLAQFPSAPRMFREELAEVAIEEARHFDLCLNALEELGSPWGSWPVHRSLWDTVTDGDLLSRVLIVHRYMEGSGLDAGSRLLEKLSGVRAPLAREVVGTIHREEVGHVAFGSEWYRKICHADGVDPDVHFGEWYPQILKAIPRNERPDYETRRRAGFTENEIAIITEAFESTNFTRRREGPKPRLNL